MWGQLLIHSRHSMLVQLPTLYIYIDIYIYIHIYIYIYIWTLVHHGDRLLSSRFFSLILDGSIGLSAGLQSAADSNDCSVPETVVRILHSAEGDNWSPFDSKIACLCQSIDINNKHIYTTDADPWRYIPHFLLQSRRVIMSRVSIKHGLSPKTILINIEKSNASLPNDTTVVSRIPETISMTL